MNIFIIAFIKESLMEEKYLLPIKKGIDCFTEIDFPINEIKKLIPKAVMVRFDAYDYFLQSGETSRSVKG